MGKYPRIVYVPYRCKVEQPGALQHNGVTNSETEMCMWKLGILRGLGSCFLGDGKSTTLRVRSSDSAFCKNYHALKEDHAEADKNLLVIVCTVNTVYSFSILSIISTTLFQGRLNTRAHWAVAWEHHEQKTSYLAFLNVSKAYGIVWREGLWCKMRHYGVEEKFVKVCEELRSGVETRVVMNGAKSRWFGGESGLRQNCPLSPLLFNIYVMGMVEELERSQIGG